MRALPLLTLPFLLLLLAAGAAADDLTDFSEPGNPQWKRVKAATKLVAAGNLKGLSQGVLAIGTRAAKEDVEILASLALKADNPLVRLLYARGLELAGPEKSVPELVARIDKGNTFEKAKGIEALGYLRAEASIEPLFLHTAATDRTVATEAFRALARFLPKKQAKRLAAAAVGAKSDHAARRGAWAVVDVTRSPRSAAGAFKKLSRGKGPGVERAKALLSDVTEEGMDAAFRYPKTHLVGVESWFKKGREKITIEGDALAQDRLQKALDYLKGKAPGYHQLVVRAFSRIASKTSKEKVDWSSRTLIISPGVAGSALWEPHQHATLFVRGAVQMLLRDVGDIHWMRRGFEQAAKNVYWFAENHSGYKTDQTLGEYVDGVLGRKYWR